MRKVIKDIKTLSKISNPVNLDNIPQDLISELKDTLDSTGGSGISAIQLGVPLQIFVFCEDNVYITAINPKVAKSYGTKPSPEKCLSFPGKEVIIERPKACLLTAYNEKGQLYTYNALGYQAAIVCHELDHLGGNIEKWKDSQEKH